MPVSRGTAIDEAARARYIDSTTGTDEETEIAPNSGGLLPRILSPPFRVFAVAIIAVALTCPALAAPTWPSWPSLSEASASASNIVPAEYTPSAHGEVVGEAAIRAAFAAVVDPFGAWFVQENNADEGWTSQLSLLFGFGGEGTMSVLLDGPDGELLANITIPHRPAAFPSYLLPEADLPKAGVLVPFQSLPPPNKTSPWDLDDLKRTDRDDGDLRASLEPPERACVSPAWPPMRPSYPSEPYVIALVERGGCDFAAKVRAAQERGAAAVVVGDKKLRSSETDEEGRHRESLLTMFSPEDTTGIIIPSVFVSRASYLLLRDLFADPNNTIGGRPGLKVDISAADDDGSALGSLLTFALLMPTLFLLATVTAHRVRVARQREANRAPPTVVLSLPERVWSPDIVWEKDSDESDKDEDAPKDAVDGEPDLKPSDTEGAVIDAVAEAEHADDEGEDTAAGGEDSSGSAPKPKKTVPRKRGKERRKSKTKRYYSKDECAICMDNFHRGEIVRILPCGHVFHKDECDEWLLKWRKLCPTCRADVTVSPGDLSASVALTPVVDPEAPVGVVVPPGWRQRLSAVGARAESAALAVTDTFRAIVGRRPLAARVDNIETNARPSTANEQTPLLGP